MASYYEKEIRRETGSADGAPSAHPPAGFPSAFVTVPDPESLLSEAEVSEAMGALSRLDQERDVEAWRTEHLGRKSRLMLSLRALGRLDPSRRAAVGRLLNDAKTRLGGALQAKQAELKARRTRDLASLDVSLPGRPLPAGGLHPITRTERAVVAAFASMGFHVIEGPEVELEYYNFEALRIPADHPARDGMDTFYLDGPDGGTPLLLRTHTSPNQIRYMEQHEPPIRLIAPGRTYRNEATDATHEWMITQTEVLAVDRGLTLAHLKGLSTSSPGTCSGRTGKSVSGVTISRSWSLESRCRSAAPTAGSKSSGPAWCIPRSSPTWGMTRRSTPGLRQDSVLSGLRCSGTGSGTSGAFTRTTFVSSASSSS